MCCCLQQILHSTHTGCINTLKKSIKTSRYTHAPNKCANAKKYSCKYAKKTVSKRGESGYTVEPCSLFCVLFFFPVAHESSLLSPQVTEFIKAVDNPSSLDMQ